MVRELYIGSISGTSLDGIDLALVEMDGDNGEFKVIGSICHPINSELKSTLSQLCLPGHNEIERLGQADVAFGKAIADGVHQLIESKNLSRSDITAIGSHGQTIRHRPSVEHPFTIQLGNASVIAEETGITCIADFRMADMASGGQGAPLASAFHQAIFASQNEDRLILNLGGIANISLVRANSSNSTTGYDIGPANGLMDRWIEKHNGSCFDEDGNWARTGNVIESLLAKLLSTPYFLESAPKSTGRELFNLEWLESQFEESEAPEDIQRTLLELTARTCAEAILSYTSISSTTYLCGGGAHNSFLRERLEELIESKTHLTDDLGIPVDDVEAALFAWLAAQTTHHQPGNCPSVTGAAKSKILGGIYYP